MNLSQDASFFNDYIALNICVNNWMLTPKAEEF